MKLGLGNKDKKTDSASSAKGKGTSLASFWFAAFVGVALAVVLGFAAVVYLEMDKSRQRDEQSMEQQASALAQRLSERTRAYQQILRGLSTDPALRALFESTDPSEWPAREEALAALFPNVMRVRLLAPGHDKTDLKSEPPLSFASLSLLRVAESSDEPPLLEVFQARTPQAHLVGVAVVKDDAGEPLGLIHVSLDASPLRKWLSLLDEAPGVAGIQQKVDGQFVTLFSGRHAGEISGDPVGTHRIAGSQIRLVRWNRPSELNLDFIALGVAGSVLLLAGLALTIQYRRQRKAVDADQAVLVQMVEDVFAGRKPRRSSMRIRNYGYLANLLAQRLSAVGDAGASRQSAAKPAPGAAPESSPETPSEGGFEPPPIIGDAAASAAGASLPESIFRSFDIRGIVGQSLTVDAVKEIGRAIGSQAYDQGQQTVIVARDARESGPSLSEALVEGITASGRDVIDLGMAPVPILYFATHFLGSNSGVMVTAGHHSANYNGLKLVVGGDFLSGEAIQALRERVLQGNLLEGAGTIQTQDLVPDYIERIADDISIARPLKVVVDCAGGCTALVAPNLYRALGCDVVELNCEVNAHAGQTAPSQPESLKALQDRVVAEQADVGLAFDGDGDRLGVVDSAGRIIWTDRLMMLMSSDVLSRHPGGDVIFDVKCSRALASQILQNGGRPVMWKSGHALLKTKLAETGALLAGEWSGHIMFRERWFGFDDAQYAGARLLEILAVDPRTSAEVFADYPEYVSTPELLLEVAEGEQYDLMDGMQRQADLLGNAKLTTIDGLRAEFEDGWGLVSASNNDPALSFRFEADTEQALERIQSLYRGLLAEVAPQLDSPF